MPALEFLPSICDRETITCRRCNTRQYPKNGHCIRCHCALGLSYVNLEIGSLLDPGQENRRGQLARWIGALLRSLRKRRGITQSQLSMRADGCIARTYLSKAECGLALLPLSKLLPLAQALGLTAVILRFETAAPRKASKSDSRR